MDKKKWAKRAKKVLEVADNPVILWGVGAVFALLGQHGVMEVLKKYNVPMK